MVVIGATNCPELLDDAVIRRLSRRVYVGMPDADTRLGLLHFFLRKTACDLSKRDMARLVTATDGYSTSDLKDLARDAAMGPVRDLGHRLAHSKADAIGKVTFAHFQEALANVPPSVTAERLAEYDAWDQQHNRRRAAAAGAVKKVRNYGPPPRAAAPTQTQPRGKPSTRGARITETASKEECALS